MPYLTKKEAYLARKKLDMKDYEEMAKISRDRKMKRWKSGYTVMQFRNFAREGHTCSPEIRELILEFIKKKEVDRVFR